MTPSAHLRVPDAELEDLQRRLRATRWSEPWALPGWDAGTPQGELRRLVALWASDYDWRHHERALEALPSRAVDIDGTPVHYLHFAAEVPGALPLVLTHGWPSSVLELTALARRLATPSRYGGRAEDAFEIVVPSLPGFGWSPARPRVAAGTPTHELWHRLMYDELGHDRYGAHGGDLGAGVTSNLGGAHPEAVVGIHLLAVREPLEVDPETLTAEERTFRESVAAWSAGEGGYLHQQATRPVTLSYGLSDSPVGLLAWILEKYRAWTDGEGLPASLSDDFVLTQASLYWFTNTIGTSLRPYYEAAFNRSFAAPRVRVPTAVALFPGDLVQPPRSWAERSYEVARYTRMPRGGHFAAIEEPELLAADITAFFGPLR
ncbi:epoxide hydrolase family protein [Patulibacter americanus]|uniref:epoxide hydrolase family protein n=1 Tax=Patulibacter americanus TaxID=588672 RepID=UPI0004919188|nr:epoxide hydrolase family protein [Patulibacter americanus]